MFNEQLCLLEQSPVPARIAMLTGPLALGDQRKGSLAEPCIGLKALSHLFRLQLWPSALLGFLVLAGEATSGGILSPSMRARTVAAGKFYEGPFIHGCVRVLARVSAALPCQREAVSEQGTCLNRADRLIHRSSLGPVLDQPVRGQGLLA